MAAIGLIGLTCQLLERVISTQHSALYYLFSPLQLTSKSNLFSLEVTAELSIPYN